MPYTLLSCDECDVLITNPGDAADGHGNEDETCYCTDWSPIDLFTGLEVDRYIAGLSFVILTAHKDGGYFMLVRTPKGEMSTRVETVGLGVPEGLAAAGANGSSRALVVTPNQPPTVESCPSKVATV